MKFILKNLKVLSVSAFLVFSFVACENEQIDDITELEETAGVSSSIPEVGELDQQGDLGEKGSVHGGVLHIGFYELPRCVKNNRGDYSNYRMYRTKASKVRYYHNKNSFNVRCPRRVRKGWCRTTNNFWSKSPSTLICY